MTQDGPTQSPSSDKICWSCGFANPDYYNFCSNCGSPLMVPPPYQPEKQTTIRNIGRLMGAYSTIPLLIIMVVNVVITLWAIGLVYPNMDLYLHPLYIVTPWLVTFAKLGGWSFLFYYIFLAIAISASFFWMMWKSIEPLERELKGEPVKEHSPLFIIGTLFMAILAFNILFYAIVSALGSAPSIPDLESPALWEIIYGFANASVWEEVVTRILLIGIPLFSIDSIRRAKAPELNERKLRQYILGGGLDIGKVEASLLVFSSIMFGIAHVWSWDLWKIIPAFAAGLAFGYLFLKLGVYASIVLHFAFDFLSVPLAVWPESLTLVLIIGLMSLVWMAVGMPFLIYYISKALGWVTGRRIWPDAPFRARSSAQMNSPPAYSNQEGYPPQQPIYKQDSNETKYRYNSQYRHVAPADPMAFGYICPHCGNMEARYEDGKVICTRCGRDQSSSRRSSF
ncbi:MAG: CPBP family intramembrane metalloprotease [Euryarchaeota archaeon]|nr:CPBP family intramembrane metalloprotease [Euryarchaeota archaeon]